MSYNLYAEGDLDYVALSRETEHFQVIEIFPIAGDGGPDALGIAIPSGRAELEGAADELSAFVQLLQVMGAQVHDLVEGTRIETDDDLAQLVARVIG